MNTCDLCRSTFPDADELTKHVAMENAVDWPVDGLTIADGGGVGVSQRPFRRPCQRNNGGIGA